MPKLPTPLRAAIGLVAEAGETVRSLPDKAVELPMLAVSTALQMSLRAQQRYAALTARGDALLSHRAVTDDAPPWATFDDPVDDPIDDPVDDVPTPPPAAKRVARKPVNPPRGSAPSAFDAVGDGDATKHATD